MILKTGNMMLTEINNFMLHNICIYLLNLFLYDEKMNSMSIFCPTNAQNSNNCSSDTQTKFQVLRLAS